MRVDGFSAPYHVALLGPGSFRSDGTYEISGRRSARRNAPRRRQSREASRRATFESPRRRRPASRCSPLQVTTTASSFTTLARFPCSASWRPAARRATTLSTRADASRPPTRKAAPSRSLRLSPWRVSRIGGVPFGDEIAVDDASNALFVTNRDVGGNGALTRVAGDGSVATVVTGRTAEGLAIDQRRQLVYVANVNDDTVAVVNARSMHVVRRFRAVPRVFSLALSPDGLRLYAVSNQSAGSPFAAPGAVVAIDLRRSRPRVVARSGDLTFPIGEVLDARTGTLFVTDEELDAVDVLDARTLAAKRAPLPTCRTPWKPTIDSAGRLFVPCARADRIDAFDSQTLRRLAHAPFATGGYPLAVAVWPGSRASNDSHRR